MFRFLSEIWMTVSSLFIATCIMGVLSAGSLALEGRWSSLLSGYVTVVIMFFVLSLASGFLAVCGYILCSSLLPLGAKLNVFVLPLIGLSLAALNASMFSKHFKNDLYGIAPFAAMGFLLGCVHCFRIKRRVKQEMANA